MLRKVCSAFLLVCSFTVSAELADEIATVQRKVNSGLKKAGKTSSAMKSRSFRHSLAVAEFYRRVDCDTFRKFYKTELGKSFLKGFLADHEWLEQTLCQGVPLSIGRGSGELSERYAVAIERLAFINKKFPSVRKNRMLKTIASATAFSTIGRNSSPEGSLRGYDYFAKSYMTKRLTAEFSSFEPWLVRMVVARGDQSKWMQENYCMPPKSVMGAAWQISYRLHNVFCDSIHSTTYPEPWGDILDRAEFAIKVGGVCGSISTTGTLACNANGVPAITMGQPGHCAFAYYNIKNNSWHRCNDVDRPSTSGHIHLHQSFNGFSLLPLMTATFSPYKKYSSTAYYNWLGHFYSDKSPQKADSLFERATKLHPLAYDFMNDYVKAVSTRKKVRNEDILKLAEQISTTFSKWPDQAWQLIANMKSSVSKLSDADRMKLIENFHKAMPKSAMDGHVMYRNIITDQFELCNGNRAAVIKMIKSHYTGRRNPALVDLEFVLNPPSKK